MTFETSHDVVMAIYGFNFVFLKLFCCKHFLEAEIFVCFFKGNSTFYSVLIRFNTLKLIKLSALKICFFANK